MPISTIYSITITYPKLPLIKPATSTMWRTCSGCTLKAHGVEHYESIGETNPMQLVGATWVMREHRIEYLRTAYLDEKIEIITWVENVRRVRSLRKYEFVRKSDRKVLVKGETDWVFVDAKKARRAPCPKKYPKYLRARERNNFRVN